MKPSPDRLYGRRRGHRLRARQALLLHAVLPRLRLASPEHPGTCFVPPAARIAIEIGFGSGEHARALAAAEPGRGLIACEVFEPGICALLSALVPDGEEETAALPGNLRLWDGDARALLARLPEASLDAAFLMFPDPWPKARHAKRRFVHPETVRLLGSRLRPGGEWRIATDDPVYQAWVEEVMARSPLFLPAAPAALRPAGWPPTRYEAKALAAGRRPLYWSFRRALTSPSR